MFDYLQLADEVGPSTPIVVAVGGDQPGCEGHAGAKDPCLQRSGTAVQLTT